MKREQVFTIALLAYLVLSYPANYWCMKHDFGYEPPSEHYRPTGMRAGSLALSPFTLPGALLHEVADSTMPEEKPEPR